MWNNPEMQLDELRPGPAMLLRLTRGESLKKYFLENQVREAASHP
jgi:hypothetical protein